MYMVIYSINSGEIRAITSGEQQTLEVYCHHFPEEQKSQFGSIYISEQIFDYENYRVINGELIEIVAR